MEGLVFSRCGVAQLPPPEGLEGGEERPGRGWGRRYTEEGRHRDTEKCRGERSSQVLECEAISSTPITGRKLGVRGEPES